MIANIMKIQIFMNANIMKTQYMYDLKCHVYVMEKFCDMFYFLDPLS